MKKYIIGAICILVLIIIGIGIQKQRANQSSEEGVIKLGGAFVLSGSDTVIWGEVTRNATVMAVDEINARGGILGRKVELIIEDTRGNSQGSVLAT